MPLKQPKVLAKHQEAHHLDFFNSCFTASVTPSVNTPERSNGFAILKVSSICSFEMNKVNYFRALTAPFPLIFLSSLFIANKVALEAILLTNPGMLFY